MSSDTEMFDLTGAEGLGFKNATAIVVLKSDICDGGAEQARFRAGERVFVKIGERDVNCAFAAACAGLRRAVGMTQTAVVRRQLLVMEDWAGLCSDPSWAAGVERRLRRLRRDCGAEAKLPVLVAGEFEGGANLVDRKVAFHGAPNAGLEFLKVLLFRKYVGSADTNARNIMFRVTPSGCAELLSVDETEASKEQLVRYAKKGLVTAQAISRDLLAAARTAWMEEHRAIASFLRALALEARDHVPTGPRLELVRAQAPFDAGSLELLESGDEEGLASLAKELRLGAS